MWIADNWKDFEVIDCSEGEKLERWKDYYLVRPDPQTIWKTECTHPKWNRPDAVYRRSKSGGGEWQKNKLPERWTIDYKDLTFNVKPMNFKHTGIFPEQAANWDFIIDRVQNAGRLLNVLNLFAYTGGATLAAAYAGASVCHVDAAKGMVSWARENAASSNLADKPIRWIVDDCGAFVAREIKRGKKYDAIIMDPPSFGRGPSGELWKIEDNLYDFIKLCSGVLSDDPEFIILNSYTTGLAPSVAQYILSSVITPLYGGSTTCDELGLPVRESGLCLPCGAAARWTK